MRCIGHAAYIKKMNTYKIWVLTVGRGRHSWENDIKMYLKRNRLAGFTWHRWAPVNTVINAVFHKSGKNLAQLGDSGELQVVLSYVPLAHVVVTFFEIKFFP